MLRTSSFHSHIVVALLLALGPVLCASDTAKPDNPKPGEPTDPKARKTFETAIDWQKHGDRGSAMESFRKANKQDGGHCSECLRRAYSLALSIHAFKDAESIARDWLPMAQTDAQKAAAHYRIGLTLQKEGENAKKDSYFTASCEELKSALQLEPRMPLAHFLNGVSLAHLHQDDAARVEFQAFLDQDRDIPAFHERAERFLERIDLARATMAPPFSLVTLDGQHISMDGLAGKVVLIDFWATWCGPCREALPHIQSIARKFQEQPLVVLSISLDSDEAKWRDFVQKNGMTWMQYRDAGFNGRISTQFGVRAIPATFTIDADGVLEDQHVGDANIEGKLKKLVARAVEVSHRKPIAPLSPDDPTLRERPDKPAASTE